MTAQYKPVPPKRAAIRSDVLRPIDIQFIDGSSLRFAIEPLRGLKGRPTAANIVRFIAERSIDAISGYILTGPTEDTPYPRHEISVSAIVWIDDIGWPGRSGWETQLTGHAA